VKSAGELSCTFQSGIPDSGGDFMDCRLGLWPSTALGALIVALLFCHTPCKMLMLSLLLLPLAATAG